MATVLFVTGIVVWWPGVAGGSEASAVKRGVGWKRFNWDLHSALGFWLFLFMLMWGISGFYLGVPGAVFQFRRLDLGSRRLPRRTSWRHRVVVADASALRPLARAAVAESVLGLRWSGSGADVFHRRRDVVESRAAPASDQEVEEAEPAMNRSLDPSRSPSPKPEIMRAWIVPKGCTSLDQLRLVERADPVAGPHDVVVRVRATSLNYRDQAIVAGQYFGGAVSRDTVPLSDGAGEVIAVGSACLSLQAGRSRGGDVLSTRRHHQRRSARLSTACWRNRSC